MKRFLFVALCGIPLALFVLAVLVNSYCHELARDIRNARIHSIN